MRFYHRTEIRFVQLCTLSMTMQFITTLCICLLANYGHYSEMNIGFSANVLMLISSQVAMTLCTHYAIAKTNSVANELIIQVAFISIAAIMIAIDNKTFTARNIYIFFNVFWKVKKLLCHGQPRRQNIPPPKKINGDTFLIKVPIKLLEDAFFHYKG